MQPNPPWERAYPPGITWRAPLRKPLPVESLLIIAAEQWPERAALTWERSSLSYHEFAALALRAAAGLQRLGLTPGTTVGLHLPNSVHYCIAFFGALLAGARIANYTAGCPAQELQRQVRHSEAVILVTTVEMALQTRVEEHEYRHRYPPVVSCDTSSFDIEEKPRLDATGALDRHGETSFVELLAGPGIARPHRRGALHDEVAALQYTRGTSGESRAALLTHANFSYAIQIFDEWEKVSSHDLPIKLLAAHPFAHIVGLVTLLIRSVALGRELVLMDRFHPGEALEEIASRRIAGVIGAPAMYSALLEHPRATQFDLSCLRVCGCSGAALTASTLRGFHALSGVYPLNGYALTETTCVGTWQAIGSVPKPFCAGLPLPNVMLDILDVESGTDPLPAGSEGEICLSGPTIMRGYWKAPASTARMLRAGRFHTGDMGRLNADGSLTVVGRLEDMILTGAHDVAALR